MAKKCDKGVQDFLHRKGFKRRYVGPDPKRARHDCEAWLFEGPNGDVHVHDDCSPCIREGDAGYALRSGDIQVVLTVDDARGSATQSTSRPTNRDVLLDEITHAMDQVARRRGPKKRKTKKNGPPHEGMIYNPYSDTWSWF